MRQVWITKIGPPEVLQVREAPDPEPGASEVRIRVEASGINFADLLARMGMYPDAPGLPCVIGYEVAGRIDAIGEGVTELQPGQEVLALTPFGGYSDVVCVPAIAAYARPAQMSAYEGAALLVNYLTAYQLLVVMGSLHQGDRVLIHSAAGGVGLAALDICKIYGAIALGTASASKHAFLRARGLHHPIDYRTLDYAAEVQRITNGDGVELILDSLGGEHWKKNYDLLAPTGRLLCYGTSTLMSPERRRTLATILRIGREIPRTSPPRLMDANKGILGVNAAHLRNKPHLIRAWGEQLLTWYTEGKIAPHVDKVFSFDEVVAAHYYLQERKAIGKILLKP